MKHRSLPFVLLLAVCATSCATAPPRIDDVNRVLDDWHKAAADADESRYFGYAAPEFVFLGTDASERWDLNSFRAFAHPYFAKGKAWTFVPHDRHIQPSPREDVAWFDEKLTNASYGECRGSGVLRHTRDGWKIAEYNLTIPIPNDLAKSVVQMIREGGKK
jgi:hypothetical protein